MEKFNQKFRVEELLIGRVGAWNISLRPQQPTIGSLILSLSRKCPSFSELTEQEAIELGQSFKEIEKLLGRAFSPQKINYLALMMVDNQVHYHVLPRYAAPIVVDGVEYEDKCWPMPHNLEPIDGANESIVTLIFDHIMASNERPN